MKKLRFIFALWVAKLCYRTLRILKRQGSHQPGYLALKICPDFLSMAPKANLCIAVTGTNGKTTTANLLTDALLAAGLKTVSNRAGANIDTGCATNLANSLTLFGKCKVDATVFEVDERFSRIILPAIQPDYLVVTNIFRDSLKRNANPDYIYSIINTYCPKHTKLVLNADDLQSCTLLENQERTYFNVLSNENVEEVYENIVMDSAICPKCHTKLKYTYRHYHHIGKAYCPNCDFKSPDSDVVVSKINEQEGTIELTVSNETLIVPLLSNALFNVYNQAAIVAMLYTLGWDLPKIKDVFNHLHLPASRLNQVEINGIKITQAMSKGQSAVSSCRTFDFVSQQPGKKAIILALDDEYDKKNSIEFWGWIYDVDYELLNKDDIMQVIALGPRCYDHQVRLLLAGVKEDRIFISENENDIEHLIKPELLENIYILYDTSTVKNAQEIKNTLIKRLGAK